VKGRCYAKKDSFVKGPLKKRGSSMVFEGQCPISTVLGGKGSRKKGDRLRFPNKRGEGNDEQGFTKICRLGFGGPFPLSFNRKGRLNAFHTTYNYH